MALFDKLDELAKAAGEGAKKAGEKAGAFIDAKKIDFKIAEKNEEIRDLKAQLGDIYWQKYAAGEQLDVTAGELCGQIQGKLNDIEALKAEAGKSAGETGAATADVKFCQNCGEKLTGDAAFCPKCGMKAN